MVSDDANLYIFYLMYVSCSVLQNAKQSAKQSAKQNSMRPDAAVNPSNKGLYI